MTATKIRQVGYEWKLRQVMADHEHVPDHRPDPAPGRARHRAVRRAGLPARRPDPRTAQPDRPGRAVRHLRLHPGRPDRTHRRDRRHQAPQDRHHRRIANLWQQEPADPRGHQTSPKTDRPWRARSFTVSASAANRRRPCAGIAAWTGASAAAAVLRVRPSRFAPAAEHNGVSTPALSRAARSARPATPARAPATTPATTARRSDHSPPGRRHQPLPAEPVRLLLPQPATAVWDLRTSPDASHSRPPRPAPTSARPATRRR